MRSPHYNYRGNLHTDGVVDLSSGIVPPPAQGLETDDEDDPINALPEGDANGRTIAAGAEIPVRGSGSGEEGTLSSHPSSVD